MFPDARFVMTHRDPASVLGSVCSLLAHDARAHGNDRPSRARSARAELAAWVEAMRRLLAVRARVGEERFADVHFHELDRRSGRGDRARIRAARDVRSPPRPSARIAAYAAAHPRGRLGDHRYRLEDWGLDRAGVHAAFSFYTDRCGVKREG